MHRYPSRCSSPQSNPASASVKLSPSPTPRHFYRTPFHLQPFSPPSVQPHLAVALETSAAVTAGCHVTQTVSPPLCARAIGSSLPPPPRPLVIYELSAWSAAPPGDEESPSCWFFLLFSFSSRDGAKQIAGERKAKLHLLPFPVSK